MVSTSPQISRPTTKRRLVLRDSLTFLALCGVSLVLFLITLFLFRSFELHREDLGRRWAERGRQALQQGRAEEAVGALRTALTYQNDLSDQLLLAQALDQAGHTEEATNYYLTLRETRPGDGLINLQLARLTRKQGDAQQAIDFYRAAILGNWQGDGVVRRREARLELAGYLAQRGATTTARDELLIAAGNMPETAANDAMIADRLAIIGFNVDALGFYRKSLALDGHDRAVLARAGRLAYNMGEYGEAARLLASALSEKGHGSPLADEKELATLEANARRVPELTLSRDLPAAVRAEHLLLASGIAQSRLQHCMSTAATSAGAPGSQQASTGATQPVPPDPTLVALKTRWSSFSNELKKRSLERDAALEDSVAQLIDDTEQQTLKPCGTPEGDNALLLMLANSPRAAH